MGSLWTLDPKPSSLGFGLQGSGLQGLEKCFPGNPYGVLKKDLETRSLEQRGLGELVLNALLRILSPKP